MKNFSGKLTAIFTAAVMTVSSVGIAVSAAENTSAETAGPAESVAEETAAPKYTGWSVDESGWRYLEDGVPCTGDRYRYSLSINGVHYDFSGNGLCLGKYTGWSENGKIYYNDGLPYTGWLNKKNGTKQYYCIDGYPVTGDFQIGDTVYSFNKSGGYTEKSTPAPLTAGCAEKVSVDAEKIPITVKYNDGNDNVEYTLGEPAKMERWENGKWKRCGKASQYAVDDIAYELGGLGDCSVNSTKVMFYPHRYMGGDMTAGYYRIAVPCSYGKTKKNVYAVFQAVPAVEVKPSEEIFLANDRGNTTVSIIAAVNSDKETFKLESLAKSLKLEIMKKTASGWEHCEDNGYSAGYTDNKNELEISAEFPAEAGYYKAAINLGGKDYSVPFRVETIDIDIDPWLDEYSLKNDDITVSFTVKSRLDVPIKLNADPYILYKKTGGNWESVPAADTSTCRGENPQYITLEKWQFAAVSLKLSEYYDTSKLGAGDYAVLIDGAGLAEFRLTDKEEEKGNFPFSNLKSEDIKEIRIILHECGSDHTLKASFKNGNDPNGYLERSVDYLRQLKFKRSIEKYTTDAAGGCPIEVIVRLKNGRKKTLYFYESGAVLYNGSKTYICNKYVCPEFNDFVIENNDVDKYYYGYRNTP